MGACYALGTFNDNFFKQAALLLAITAGMHTFQGQATFLFALPFMLLSAWAGWLADRFSKKTIIVCPSCWRWPPCWPEPTARSPCAEAGWVWSSAWG